MILVVMIYHIFKLEVILADLFVLSDLNIADIHGFEGGHVEVIFEREMDTYFTGFY